MTSAVELCIGQVMHARSRPKHNRFSYPVFFLRLCLTDPAGLAAASGRLFGYNRAGLVSFQSRDHAERDGGDLLSWLDSRLARAGVQRPGGAVWLQTFPRVLGFVFKPVSFWHCHDEAGALRVLLAEVNNTFGERHQYVLTAPGGAPIQAGTELVCRKHFHVSPFCDVKGEYRFRVRHEGERHVAVIDYYDEPGEPLPLLKTAIWGRAQPMARGPLLRTVLRMPLLTFGVVARIHWQALKLWWMGVPFFSKPAAPRHEISHNVEVKP